jgi:hypothetical protein
MFQFSGISTASSSALNFDAARRRPKIDQVATVAFPRMIAQASCLGSSGDNVSLMETVLREAGESGFEGLVATGRGPRFRDFRQY